MRSISILGVALGACLGLTSIRPAAAESPLEGPFATPGNASTAPAKPAKAKPAHKKPAKTAKRTAPKTYGQGYEPTAAPDAHPLAPTAAPNLDDPVSFGMKWNGSNDSARDTRVQNYNGDAAGTGAEVGMKLHF